MITTRAPQSSLETWAAPLVLIVLLLLTQLLGGWPRVWQVLSAGDWEQLQDAAQHLGDWGREQLRYDRAAIGVGEWWRFITGNFVHLGWYHWALNEMGLVVLVLLCPEPLSPLVWTRRVLLLCLGMSAGLYWLVPGLTNYVGMSGVIHGLFVLGLMPQVLKRDLIALGCLLYLLGKLGYELYAGAPVSDEQAIGGSVVTLAHFYGSISAFVYGLIFRTYTRKETWSLQT